MNKNPWGWMKVAALAAVWTAALSTGAIGAERSIHVFVALCDNLTQGIVPVGKKIGNGDDADANLYWGCSDGMGSYFKRSKQWKVESSESDVSPIILRRLKLRHVSGDMVLTAEAYRGSAMKQCVEDFQRAVGGGKADVAVYIGHNALMDGEIGFAVSNPPSKTETMVLCCVSQRYFAPRLEKLGGRSLLMTQQLMYPGAFLVHDALEVWRAGGSLAEIRQAAAKAYAKNQKISVKAALGVFADLK